MTTMVSMNNGPRIRIDRLLCMLLAIALALVACVKPAAADDLADAFRSPPPAARPWVFWYWMNGNVSRAGITADLEAMHEAGLGGAYLMPIKRRGRPAAFRPPVEQLATRGGPRFAMPCSEADRLGLQFAMHVCDGFATAGGPWITPELSMQKLVWTETQVSGGRY